MSNAVKSFDILATSFFVASYIIILTFNKIIFKSVSGSIFRYFSKIVLFMCNFTLIITSSLILFLFKKFLYIFKKAFIFLLLILAELEIMP